MYDFAAVRCALDALGREHVMFPADYPFEIRGGGHFMDNVPLDEKCAGGRRLQQRGKAVGL